MLVKITLFSVDFIADYAFANGDCRDPIDDYWTFYQAPIIDWGLIYPIVAALQRFCKLRIRYAQRSRIS